MNNAKSTIHGGLYDFLREAKKRTFPQDSTKDFIPLSTRSSTFKKSSRPNYNNESYQKIAPIIPKNFTFIIKAATFSAVKENSQNDFSAKMHLFSVSFIYQCTYFFMKKHFFFS